MSTPDKYLSVAAQEKFCGDSLKDCRAWMRERLGQDAFCPKLMDTTSNKEVWSDGIVEIIVYRLEGAKLDTMSAQDKKVGDISKILPP